MREVLSNLSSQEGLRTCNNAIYFCDTGLILLIDPDAVMLARELDCISPAIVRSRSSGGKYFGLFTFAQAAMHATLRIESRTRLIRRLNTLLYIADCYDSLALVKSLIV